MKIATCCYCGTRAVLRFDRGRHELVCRACGAPLHNMKAMPQAAPAPAPAQAPRSANRPVKRYSGTAQKQPSRYREADHEEDYKYRGRKRKSVRRRIFEDLWDVVEDIFD